MTVISVLYIFLRLVQIRVVTQRIDTPVNYAPFDLSATMIKYNGGSYGFSILLRVHGKQCVLMPLL
jgi:hypothetical protein